MVKSTPIEIAIASAADICGRFELDEKARPLLSDEMGAREFVEALLANGLCVPAIDFMAHALPVQRAVWWGCLCLQHACGDNLAPPDKAAATAAVEWVLRPTEANRAAAQVMAKVAGYASAAGALARAVSWTGGSLGPPDAPPFPPGPFMPATAVAIAVKFATVKVEGDKIAGTQRLVVELGMEVAEGRYL
jgi:hypothetical protein